MLTPPADRADAIDSEVLLGVLAKVHDGDLTARLPLEWTGVAGEVADGLNDVIDASQSLEAELARVSDLLGPSGSRDALAAGSEIALADVCLKDVRRALLRKFGQVADCKGLEYSIDLADDAPAAVATDPTRLHQVLGTLIANAFRFTSRGGVHVRIGVVDDEWSYERRSPEQSVAAVSFSIRDTGVGIVADELQRIFEALADGGDPAVCIESGLGRGLSISASLATLLGGEITVASTRGEGTTFTVYLPLDPAATKHAGPSWDPPVLEALDRHHLAGKKVLVVDDDARNLFAMTALLERRRAEVICVEGGLEAITALEQTPDIDLVLMDIMMPGMDGYDTMRAIRTREEFLQLPIIAVTGKAAVGDRERCTAAGANDFLPKPVDTESLLAAIGSWLASGSGGRHQATAERPPHLFRGPSQGMGR